MTVPSTIDAAGWLRNHLESPDGDGDLARAMLQAFAEALMSAEASMHHRPFRPHRPDRSVGVAREHHRRPGRQGRRLHAARRIAEVGRHHTRRLTAAPDRPRRPPPRSARLSQLRRRPMT